MFSDAAACRSQLPIFPQSDRLCLHAVHRLLWTWTACPDCQPAFIPAPVFMLPPWHCSGPEGWCCPHVFPFNPEYREYPEEILFHLTKMSIDADGQMHGAQFVIDQRRGKLWPQNFLITTFPAEGNYRTDFNIINFQLFLQTVD